MLHLRLKICGRTENGTGDEFFLKLAARFEMINLNWRLLGLVPMFIVFWDDINNFQSFIFH